jgi:hypothetical protein
VELHHLPVLLQLAVAQVKGITLQVAVETLLTAQEELALPVAPEVVQANNQMLTEIQPL